MATTSSTPLNNNKKSFPPKRGQIKAQIFESLAAAVSSMASKAGEALGIIREGGGTSATASPAPSSYNSDG